MLVPTLLSIICAGFACFKVWCTARKCLPRVSRRRSNLWCSRQGEMEGSDLMGYLLRNRIIYIGSRINDEVRSRARLQVPARGWRSGRVCRKGAPASPCARR